LIEAVAIGTSAGGAQALSVLLPALPADTPCAIFIVMHVPRDRPSLLAEIFSRKCLLAVREAQDKEPVASGTVYFAPNDYHLLIDEGPHLALSMDDPVNHSRPSIDVLFESAALVYGKRLLGILLTGANEDGADGLAAVQEAGGVTVVQDPAGAEAPRMPLSAINRRRPDHILPLDGIAALLSAIGTVRELR
jgi:two-component system chemotaxis response regulator CheB